MSDAAACARQVRELFGSALGSEAGLLHVAVVWRSPDRGLVNIAMNEAKPASPTDEFVLGLARARCDAVVTTGANLRLEPRLSHAYHSHPRTAAALAAWRREVLGKSEAPVSVALTRRSDVDLEHPLFQHAQRSWVFTTDEAAHELRGRSRAAGLEVVGDPAPDLGRLVDHLRHVEGLASISIEAGPSTARALYDAAEPALDELMLSVLLEPELAPEAQTGPFIEEERIEAALGAPRSAREIQEPSGRWSFRRYARSPDGGE